MKLGFCLFAVALGLILNSRPAVAGSATWLTNPGSGDWNTTANWTPGGPPNDPADFATFGSSAVSELWLSARTQVGSIIFSPSGDTTYTISAFWLILSGSGITNNSGITQNFVVSGTNGEISFRNSASAGFNTTFITNGDAGAGGNTAFRDNSNAGHATFTTNGTTFSDGSGGLVEVRDSSSAGSGTFITNGSAFRHFVCPPGMICLPEYPFPQGILLFRETATAANATLIAHGGVNGGDGGWIIFEGDSTGGLAQVEVFGNGNLDLSGHHLPGMTLGSIEGDGAVFLGINSLSVGSNNLSTAFSGVIQDGNRFGGGGAGGALTKIGTGTLTLSGANTYLGTTTINAGTLKVDGSIVSAVTVNNGGALAGSGTTLGVIVDSGGTVAPGPSHVLHINGNYAQNAGGVLKIEVSDASPTASGHLDITGNATLDGTLEVRFPNGSLPVAGQIFRLFHVSGMATGSFTQIIFPDLRAGFQFEAEFVNGYYQITALNDGVPATGFLNISTRMPVGTGDNALIGGFIITGNAPKKVILRAIGPSLAPLPGRLADPTLELRDGAGGLIFSNDNWVESPQAQQIIDSTIPPSDDHEAAIVATLTPGSYTAIMRGAGNTTGIGVVEVYDLALDVPATLANISSRGFVETGDNVMIGGFIAGNQATPVIVRAIGPSLTQFGIANALADPTLELHDGNGAMIAFNNDWRDNAEAAIEGTGIAPTNDKESAILTTLAPGSYTAIVRGLNDTTGVGLVEVYHLQ